MMDHDEDKEKDETSIDDSALDGILSDETEDEDAEDIEAVKGPDEFGHEDESTY